MEISRRRYQSSKIMPSKRRVMSSIPRNNKDSKLNKQTRKRLKINLFEQLTKKLNAYNYQDIVLTELEQFLKKYKIINEKILKQLENVIKLKIQKKYEEELKIKQYNISLRDKHLLFLNELELEKDNIIKERKLREKDLIDIQNREFYLNQRIEELKNILYEKRLNQYKSKGENLSYSQIFEKNGKILEDGKLINSVNDKNLYKDYLLEKMKEENDEIMEETIAEEIRTENERRKLYKSVEKSRNIFPKCEIKNSIKNLHCCLFNKEFCGNNLSVLINSKDIKFKQKLLSDFYDNQILLKKLKKEYERYIDKVQAEIFKKDCNDYLRREMQIKEITQNNEIINVREIDKQIKNGKYDIDKITPFERKYNHDLFQKVSEFHKKNCYY